MDIAVSYHDTVTKLQGLAARAEGPFDRPEWFALLERGGARAVIASAGEGANQVVFPLHQAKDGFDSLTNWFSFTWRPLGACAAARSAIARDLRSKTGLVRMAPLAADVADELQSTFRQAGWLVFREQCDENHVLAVGGRSFAEYWEQRPGKMRTTLKRKAKKVDVEILAHFDEDAWAEYRAIYQQSWKPEEERADILEGFARAEGAAGRIRLGIARADGVPVAAQFWTVENGTAYIHKLAHVEAARPLSAGTTLSAALFERVIDRDRVETVDFGTGSDSYKRDWMERIRPRYRLTCLDWRRPSLWLRIAKATARHLAPPMPRG